MEADLNREEQQGDFGDGGLLSRGLLGGWLRAAFDLTGQGSGGQREQGAPTAGVPPRLVQGKVVRQQLHGSWGPREADAGHQHVAVTGSDPSEARRQPLRQRQPVKGRRTLP